MFELIDGGKMTFLLSKILLSRIYQLLDSIPALSTNFTQIMMRVATLDMCVLPHKLTKLFKSFSLRNILTVLTWSDNKHI